MPDEPTIYEVGRNVRDIKQSVADLTAKVEKFQLDLVDLRHQVTENSKDIAEIQGDRKAEKQEKTSRRWLMFTAIAAPIIVALVLAIAAIALTMYVAYAKGLNP